MARMNATVIEIREGCETNDADHAELCREKRERNEEPERRRTERAQDGFADDRSSGFLPRAVPLSPLVVIREDSLPFAAFLGFALVELVEVLGFSLHLPGKLHLGGPEFLETIPDAPPCLCLREFLPSEEEGHRADDGGRERDEGEKDRGEERVGRKETAEWVPGEPGGKLDLISPEKPPDDEGECPHARHNEGAVFLDRVPRIHEAPRRELEDARGERGDAAEILQCVEWVRISH